MEIQVLNHACVRLADAVVLYTDPFGLSAHANDADLIFITHMHHDHFSPLDIAKVRKDTPCSILPKNELPRIAHVGFNARNVRRPLSRETRG
jgi:L-ascorbate metabolism protein UlaG (beta-lactamase superfamily)